MHALRFCARASRAHENVRLSVLAYRAKAINESIVTRADGRASNAIDACTIYVRTRSHAVVLLA